MSDDRDNGPRCRTANCDGSCGNEDDGNPIHWAVGLMDLPSELKMEVFLALFNMQSVVALRLTCRHLEHVYRRIAPAVRVDQRERIVAPFRTFFQFLDRLKLPTGTLRLPPPGGWPHISPGPGNGFEGKTDFAVDILRHLPYICEGNSMESDANIAYDSIFRDYSDGKEYPGAWMEEEYLEPMRKVRNLNKETAPSPDHHMLALAEGGEVGSDVYLDTWTGIMYEEGWEGKGISAPDIMAHDFFEDRRAILSRFDVVFVPDEHMIFRRDESRTWSGRLERHRDIVPDDDPYDAEEMERQGEPLGIEFGEFGGRADGEWVRHLYFKHGWPGNEWDKEACLEAIREYVDRRPR